MQPVDDLREQLKSLGYLSRGIERWFALDPWSSRTFWSELLLLAFKSALACCPFVAAPFVMITIWKNLPLGVAEVGWLAAMYLASSFAIIFGLVLTGALLFKLRPSLGVESQRFLTVSSMIMGGLLAAVTGFWWTGFRQETTLPQLAAGSALILLAFVVTSTVFAAALLSFSIHETRRIPQSRRRSRRGPLAVGGALLLSAVVAPLVMTEGVEDQEPPRQVIITPVAERVVLIAVDGLTDELFIARADLANALEHRASVTLPDAVSAPERWASVGTGTTPRMHGVRAVDGLRFRSSDRILQTLSARDPVLMKLAPALSLAFRQPLPPTVRRRDFAWEITSARALPSVVVNWWTAPASQSPSLISVPQEEVFKTASREASGVIASARKIDEIAAARLATAVDQVQPALAAVYLPALDIVLNRLDEDMVARVAASVTILDSLTGLISDLRQRGYQVLLVGLPGEGQAGRGIAASTLPLPDEVAAEDLAPTLLDLAGFPASNEMKGSSFRVGSSQPRIASYGARRESDVSTTVDEEYYRSLRSLGYIQ